MLQTIREFASDQLVQAGEAEVIREQHLKFFLELAESAESELTGSSQASWFERLDREHDNLRAALRCSIEQNKVEEGLRLAGSLWRFWDVRGYVTEGRGLLDDLLSRTVDTSIESSVRAKALNGAGILAGNQGDYERQKKIVEESLHLYREMDDKPGIAQSINNLGSIAYSQGDYDSAEVFYSESLNIRREIGDSWGTANSLNNLGGVAFSKGDWEGALELHSQSLELRRDLNDKRGISMD